MICLRCGRQHDGSLMRTDKRYSRVRTMLESEAPRLEDGRFGICTFCQRQAQLADGFLLLLVRDVERLARYAPRHAAFAQSAGAAQ